MVKFIIVYNYCSYHVCNYPSIIKCTLSCTFYVWISDIISGMGKLLKNVVEWTCIVKLLPRLSVLNSCHREAIEFWLDNCFNICKFYIECFTYRKIILGNLIFSNSGKSLHRDAQQLQLSQLTCIKSTHNPRYQNVTIITFNVCIHVCNL